MLLNMECPLTPRINGPALNPPAPCFHLTKTMTPNHCSDLATSVNEPPPSPASIDSVRPVTESATAHILHSTWPSPEPIKPVEPKLSLLSHVNYIKKLLIRQKRDLLHLRAATVGRAPTPNVFP